MAQLPPDVPPAAAPPTDPPAAPPAAPAAPPAGLVEPPAAELITLTSAQLDERLKRAQAVNHAKWLSDNGFENEEAFTAFKKSADDASAAADEATRQEMSDLGKARSDLETANAARAAAEARAKEAENAAEDARTEAHLRDEFAQRGFTNVDFAFHLVEQACAKLAKGETLDEAKFLDDLKKNEQQKLALGIPATPPAEGVANTAPPQVIPPPAPGGSAPVDCSKMSDEEWKVYKRENGLP